MSLKPRAPRRPQAHEAPAPAVPQQIHVDVRLVPGNRFIVGDRVQWADRGVATVRAAAEGGGVWLRFDGGLTCNVSARASELVLFPMSLDGRPLFDGHRVRVGAPILVAGVGTATVMSFDPDAGKPARLLVQLFDGRELYVTAGMVLARTMP